MNRQAAYPVEELIVQRWSPRAMSGESLSIEELHTLFEAARWAPSAMNFQPWRFLYALRDTAEWPLFFELLVEGNQVWAHNAGALLIVLSQNTNLQSGSAFKTHSFDTGAAWANFALQGSAMRLVVHAMAGFDHERARDVMGVPDMCTIEAMIAVGRPGDPSLLPEHLREREQPSDRKSLKTYSAPGTFPREWADVPS